MQKNQLLLVKIIKNTGSAQLFITYLSDLSMLLKSKWTERFRPIQTDSDQFRPAFSDESNEKNKCLQDQGWKGRDPAKSSVKWYPGKAELGTWGIFEFVQ